MATEASVTTDLTTCPICLNVFDVPKSLPCLHAFCLKCLQGYFKDKFPGDEVPCPMCRKEFQIPSDGLAALQHHFFVQQLVDFRKASSKEFAEVPCEVCFEVSEKDSDKIPIATTCCVDCNQKLCERCSRPHRRMKGGAHQVKPLGAEVEQELIQLRGSSCDKHEDKQIELYCRDCSENICLMCSAVKHRNHNSVEIPEAAENFRHRIDDYDEKILSMVSVVREQSGEAKQDAAEFRIEVEKVKKVVLATGDEVKRSADEQVSDILKQLEAMTSESGKQADNVQKTYQFALVSMESFHTYSRELLEKGRPSDITRAACQLYDRATELLNNDITAVKYHPPHVTFTPADVTQIKRLNLIGKVNSSSGNRSVVEFPLPVETEREKELAQQLKQANKTAANLQHELKQTAERERQLQMQLDKIKYPVSRLKMQQQEMDDSDESRDRVHRSPVDLEEPASDIAFKMGDVIKTLAEEETIRGVTSFGFLGKNLYVLRGNKSSEQIEVYDIDSFCLLRCLTIPGLVNAADMVACEHDRCNYICDASQRCVHRVAEDSKITQWPVNDKPTCLSLTVKHNLMVTCRKVRKIKEFTTNGQLLCEIVQYVWSPWHTVQLPSGELIVCHGSSTESLSRVCLIGSGGQVVKSFGRHRGSGGSQMNTPSHMAVDENGSVFVVDRNNSRVLLLSPTLTFVREVISREKLKWVPYRLSLDVKRRRLYVAVNEHLKVGDYTAGRVIVVSV